MRDVLATEPLASPDYVSVAATTTLRELEHIDGPALLSMAVRFGSTRLIDNEPLEPLERLESRKPVEPSST